MLGKSSIKITIIKIDSALRKSQENCYNKIDDVCHKTRQALTELKKTVDPTVQCLFGRELKPFRLFAIRTFGYRRGRIFPIEEFKQSRLKRSDPTLSKLLETFLVLIDFRLEGQVLKIKKESFAQ